jgi:hypothetical protein
MQAFCTLLSFTSNHPMQKYIMANPENEGQSFRPHSHVQQRLHSFSILVFEEEFNEL